MVGIVGVLLIAGVELIFWGWYLCRWDQLWVVLCCVVLCYASPLYLDFVDFFILFGLRCRLRCS